MSWPIVKLGDIVDIKGGGTPSKSNPDFWGGDIPWASVKDFKTSSLKETADYITELGVEKSATNVIPAGNVIVPTRMALGKVAINEVDIAINQDLKALLVRDEQTLSKLYLMRFLESKSAFIDEQGKGATVKGITLDVLRNLDVPLPPLTEQKRIATILDKADAIRRKRQQAIQLADEFLRAVFLDMFGDPVSNPKGWEVKPLGDFCRFQGGFAFKSADFTDSGVPLVKITNVHFENVDWSDISYLPEKMLTEKPDFSLRSGDLVMAMTRPIIKSLNAVKVVEIKDNDIPSLLNQRVGRFRGYEQSASKCFLKYFLYSEYFKSEVDKLCSVALQPNVSSKQIESIACYLPPKVLQDDFSRIVNVVTEALPKMNVAANEKLFESLSHRAFSGIL
ncbi:restriction endonuclease subunit S [Thalassolituus sp.]|uniref:restriction endonuclease subunit S n=1 Tax=Thalassolituus sp. TaxID=2030822 RepID=UPI0035186350